MAANVKLADECNPARMSTAIHRLGGSEAERALPQRRTSVFVIELIYKVDLEQIDAHMTAPRRFTPIMRS